ncbi:MAG: DinB family protein [Terriglobales bacterium]
MPMSTPSAHDDPQAGLKRQLLASWEDPRVHMVLAAALAGVPPELRGAQPPGQPFTLWRLLEHQRLCLQDFLDYCRMPNYVEPPFPIGYWPAGNEPPDDGAWDASRSRCLQLLGEFAALIGNPATDLFAPLPATSPLDPPGAGPRTVLRQALACLDHTAYHLGQIVLLRRLLGLPC